MKKFFKFGCLGFIALIVLIIIIAVATSGGDDTSDTPNTESTSSGETRDTAKEEKPAAKEGVLTEEKFNQINNGMAYEEVKAIIGSDGTVISESGESGSEYHTAIYEWETDGLFASANFTFQGGKLISKAQMGVTESSDVTVTLDKFDQIQNGMTYEEVIQIVGGEGNLLSESGEKGTEFYTVMYEYKGEGDLGANANFMFQGNKLQSKSQFGLK
ncbi:DUF3862 domain-containing protein [Bacillus sp. V3B]|uniref:DUF3862 domain-containing protein n=1 Tax=Bacillus sp. V3B TaxID=2804915 RepID=UPI00210868BF|nr:DUF3862 domain-containing protein [Bacillus sp. V3B]MCQ6275792.1 DUF3862 domain-containing protein [Bacillus sp. V3B]